MNQTEIMLKRLNDALPLILGILVYGVLVELIESGSVSDKIRYTTGLAIESHSPVAWQSIWQLYCRMPYIYGESRAQSKIVAKSILAIYARSDRIFVMMKWNLGNRSSHLLVFWA